MSTTKYTARLADKYKKEVVPALMKKFGYTSVMQAPKLEKICLNRGINGAVSDKKLVDICEKVISLATTLPSQKGRWQRTNRRNCCLSWDIRKYLPLCRVFRSLGMQLS